MIYQLGIMSSKWSVDAPNLDIATVVIRLSQQTTAPIACYNSPLFSRFMGYGNYSVATFEDFCKENGDAIREAYKTMVEL